jgi:serine/threonine-protein kinase
MTQTGLSLGTPQYMSPEQAMGERTIDARSDVYALGAVLYEMLAGDAPFTGGSVQAIVAKVLSERPTALYTLRDTVPAHVEQAVFTALAKLPADRYATAAAFATALSNVSGATPASSSRAMATARPLTRDPRTWVSLAAVVASILFAGLYLTRPAVSAVVSRQRVHLWQNSLQPALAPGARAVATQAAIAPDGSSIVFADTANGQLVLKRKLRNASDATILAGTDGASSPFFSPDGKWVAFLTNDFALRKIPINGGGAVTLAEDVAPDMRAGAWLDDGTIVYFAEGSLLKRLSADGGSSVALRGYKLKGAIASITPVPGSTGVLLTVCPGNCAIASTVYAYSFALDSLLLLVPRAVGAWYSPTGHLLYTAREGGLYAAGLDAKTLSLTSGAVSVIEGVDPMRFAMSASGSVLYTTDETARTLTELVWVARDGRVSPFDASWVGHFEYPALSPDGRWLAVSVRAKTIDLWLRRPDGSRQQVVAPGAASWRPSWAPDGKSLVFVLVGDVSNDLSDVTVNRVPADGSAKASLLQRDEVGLWEAELSRDGQWMLMRKDVAGSRNILQARRLTGDTALRTILDTTSVQLSLSITLSPDGRWLAYSSNESEGAINVYVTSFPDAQSKFVVSRGGGTEPKWSRDGRELFFESGGMLQVVSVPPGPTFSPGNPRPLFSLAGYRRARNRQQYDVSADGTRFLMIRERGSAEAPTVVYAENWLTELREKVQK